VEKRKRVENPHWVTPGVFSGSFVVEEAVERITSIKQPEACTSDDATWKERLEELEAQLAKLTKSLSSWEERWRAMEAEQKKEREYLYQVVLSLKKEWEKERDENRHH
jgi:septal ring factor EnvC (AmiA/AmiB activator)